MRYQPRLDALRGLSVLAIFAYHSGYFAGGWLGVQIFFVLSGYLITGILAQSRESNAGPIDYFRSFYVRRALRIFPVYFAFVAIAMALDGLIAFPRQSAFQPGTAGNIPYVFTYTYNLHKAFNTQTDYGILFGHLWSLSIEEQFYLFWPAALFCLNRRNFVFFCMCLVAAGPVFRLMEGLWQWHTGPIGREITGRFIYLFTLSHLDAFAMGALLNFRDERIVDNTIRLIAKYALPTVALIGAWMLLLESLAGYKVPISTFGWPNYLAYFYAYIWGYSVLNSIGLALIADTDRWRLIGDRLSLQRLGRVSYGFYIFHYPILWFSAIFSGIGLIQEPLLKCAFSLATFLLTWLFAELSYRFLETPFLRLKSSPRWVNASQSTPEIVDATTETALDKLQAARTTSTGAER